MYAKGYEYTMENLIFSLNATMPIFLMMVLGYVLHQIGWLDTDFASKLNKFVFLIPLPVNLFVQVSALDIRAAWDTKFVVFCFVATLLSVLAAALCSLFMKNHAERGEFVQAAYRSSASLLGVAFIENIYGTAGMAPLMIIGAVPLYNVMAVIALSVTDPENSELDQKTLMKTVRGIATNPIILGILVGLLWSLLHLPQPKILMTTCSKIGALGTPLGLMAMGAMFDFRKAFGKLGPAAGASFLKLIGFNLVFLPLAIAMGFREEKLVAVLVMLGSATTVSCYVMARNMHHEGTLTSSTVMLTTLFSAFTLTFWLWLVKTLGLM